jgi:hypothetical protein
VRLPEEKQQQKFEIRHVQIDGYQGHKCVNKELSSRIKDW